MNEQQLKELVALYKDDILKYNGKNAEHFLLIILSEVERTTRDKCTSLAYDLINAINNLNK